MKREKYTTPPLFWEKTDTEHPRRFEDGRLWAWDGWRYWPIAWLGTLGRGKEESQENNKGKNWKQ